MGLREIAPLIHFDNSAFRSDPTLLCFRVPVISRSLGSVST